jgi:hypothetical protein
MRSLQPIDPIDIPEMISRKLSHKSLKNFDDESDNEMLQLTPDERARVDELLFEIFLSRDYKYQVKPTPVVPL